MRRPAHGIAPRSLRQPVAVVAPRSLPLAVWAGVATRRGPVVPVTPRVRDSLVLRLVAKGKSHGRPLLDECRAR